MNYWVRFWVIIVGLMIAVSALGFLSLSFLFPEIEMLRIGSVGRLGVALVAASAIGVVTWGATAGSDTAGERSPGRNPGS